MKIIFFGSGKFAVKVLESIHSYGHEIPLVVTQPDRKKGRHLHLAQTPVKEYALSHGLEIFQPENINLEASGDILKKKEADVFIVVSYGRILSREILNIPRKICVNIHASLLPKYRGAAPINRALMNGEFRTGITFIRMNEHMDGGDIIFQKAVRIDKSICAPALEEKLSQLASGTINQLLKSIEKGGVQFKKQDEKKATYAPLMKKHDGLIQWDAQASKVFNNFRGCFGWPGSFTYFRKKLLKILEMEIARHGKHAKAGEIIRAEDTILEVACRSGTIIIKEVLPESHKKMSVKSFLAGHKVRVGDILGT